MINRFILLLVVLCAGCQSNAIVDPPAPMGWSVEQLEHADWSKPYRFGRALDGAPLVAHPASVGRREALVAHLHEAIEAWRAAPEDEQATIWLGRRLAYLGRYDQAAGVFTHGLAHHPDSPRLLRHRGHRFITLRKFTLAERDLARAANLVRDAPDEIEPDGAPNAQNIPRSTLHTNIYYHLGLARYLQGDFAGAADAFGTCMTISPNDDMLVASAYWTFLSHAREYGLADAAQVLEPIRGTMDVIENHDYHRLCLLFTGAHGIDAAAMERDAASDPVRLATTGYGLAAFRRLQGDEARGIAMLRTVTEGVNPAAFGAIAAEADLARMHD